MTFIVKMVSDHKAPAEIQTEVRLFSLLISRRLLACAFRCFSLHPDRPSMPFVLLVLYCMTVCDCAVGRIALRQLGAVLGPADAEGLVVKLWRKLIELARGVGAVPVLLSRFRNG